LKVVFKRFCHEGEGEAEVKHVWMQLDLAVLKVTKRPKWLKSGKGFHPCKPKLCEDVWLAGLSKNTRGAVSMSSGEVSFVGWVEQDCEMDEVAAAVLPGCSGGPLLGRDGRCRGLARAACGCSILLMIPSRVIVEAAKRDGLVDCLGVSEEP
jgi:hypothetical protein